MLLSSPDSPTASLAKDVTHLPDLAQISVISEISGELFPERL
jgi:hypothetical protein